MSSYYTKEDIHNMLPLNFNKLDEEEQCRIIEEIADSCGLSPDRVMELMDED